MEDTGRIREPLAVTARRILFGRTIQKHEWEELEQIARVDQAHLLMLSECGIVAGERTGRLLAAIHRLLEVRFAPLQNREPTRGLFLAYEDFLIETEGMEIGGILQTARSRNDVNATVMKLRLRRPFSRLIRECLRFHAVLLRRAKQFGSTVMPVYTHGQAAMPTTYGHYLAGVAKALSRDLDALLHSAVDIQNCPLGAGAVAGTSFPTRPERTAELLGFAAPPLHSIDAVASRDLVLRLLSSCAIYGITLSRLATDFLTWTTAEFAFLRLPDALVGSSSAMPQKRNPFLLEHVQGRAGALLAAFVHASTSMHAMPFTNCIAVGTEAVKPVPEAFRTIMEMVVLMRLMVAGAQPDPKAMLHRAVAGFTTATEIANRLVTDLNLDFRSAHRLVGAAVLATTEAASGSFEQNIAAHLEKSGIPGLNGCLEPSEVVLSLESGGGPGPSSFARCISDLSDLLQSHCRQNQSLIRHWKQTQKLLRKEVELRIAALNHPSTVDASWASS